jgi:flagellin-like hook-associated protein FlgL
METSMRLLITFCIGVAVTLAWHSYGDATRDVIANLSPQFGWLAPQVNAVQTAAAPLVASTTSSPDPQEIKAISADLAAVRQKVDQLAAQVTTGQNHVAREFASKLQIAAEDIVDKISALPSQPAAARVRKSSR